VVELSNGDNIVLELARVKKEKVIVLRKMQKEELGDSEYKVNSDLKSKIHQCTKRQYNPNTGKTTILKGVSS
jgi:hypothetical protein